MTIKLKKIVLLALVLVLLSTAVFIRFIGPVEAGGTITIKADGSVDPDTAPISTVDNITYTFLGNIIYDEIVVEKNNTVVDGAGYSIQGAWDLHRGISLHGGSNVTIKNIEIREFEYGIYLQHSSNNTISGNKITENAVGILLVDSSDNTINGNNITINYGVGIELDFSSNNTINGNNITNNDTGILVHLSSFDNTICHNNFIGNTQQVQIPTSGQANFWDDSYPSGGNYWSDYNGTDSDSDGIGDTAYTIDANNTDNYPLMGMFSDFPVIPQEETFHVTTICNSTISDFDLVINLETGDLLLWFDVTGSDDTVGFCRIMIPRGLMEGPYTVRVDGEEVPANELPISNSTHAFLYFTYIHSKHHVVIIPEFPTWASMLLILIVLSVATAIYKRRLPKTPTH